MLGFMSTSTQKDSMHAILHTLTQTMSISPIPILLPLHTRADPTTREVSLTAPPPTNAAGRQLTSADSPITEEDFYNCIDSNLSKVEAFTLQRVTDLRANIAIVEKEVNALGGITEGKEGEVEAIRQKADDAAKSFLTLEKYVNINFMGFHKILKKHDKNLPLHACKQFYINRMHNQAWVRGDYSDVVVRLSAIYSALRNDHAAEENKDASQSFLRSTTKYWVRTEDVSKVKYAILKHLPVFLQKTSTGESDSQLTNSVYFDNDQLGECVCVVVIVLAVLLLLTFRYCIWLLTTYCLLLPSIPYQPTIQFNRTLPRTSRQDSRSHCLQASLVRCGRPQDGVL